MGHMTSRVESSWNNLRKKNLFSLIWVPHLQLHIDNIYIKNVENHIYFELIYFRCSPERQLTPSVNFEGRQ